jgi:hypothetical protein
MWSLFSSSGKSAREPGGTLGFSVDRGDGSGYSAVRCFGAHRYQRIKGVREHGG